MTSALGPEPRPTHPGRRRIDAPQPFGAGPHSRRKEQDP